MSKHWHMASMFSFARQTSQIRHLFLSHSLSVFRLFSVVMTSTIDIDHTFYKINPVKLGIEITGIDLNVDPPKELIDAIKSDVHKYGLLIFTGQGVVSGDRHFQISRWFGELESTFYKHPKSPHPDVFRVSNDENEGCRGVGRTGWHIDGSFQQEPFAYSLYHMVEIPRKGDTVFVSMNQLISELTEEQRDRWERLWMVSDRRAEHVHPLIYSHPITGLKTLCFHLGMTEAFIWDYGTSEQRITDWKETSAILSEIHQQFIKDNRVLQYSHKWQPGDFIISDNLSVAHEASEETQHPRDEVGLRVLHRTTVKGTSRPQKKYTVYPKSTTSSQHKEDHTSAHEEL